MNAVKIKHICNNVGITKRGEYAKGDLSIGGSSLPYEQIDCFFPINHNNVYFEIALGGINDNVSACGQEINISTEAKEIHFLGMSCQGDFFEEFLINFKEDSRNYRLGFTDFLSDTPYFDDELVFRSEYAHSQFGEARNLKMSLWKNSIILNNKEYIKSIIMPQNMFLHIFSITLK